MGQLEGRVAFVTGVARGQGRSHAVRLAEEGADIIGIDVLQDDPTVHYPLATRADLDETASLIEKTGRRALLSRADIRNLAEVTAAVDRGVAALGRLDVVVANAGIFSMGALLDLDERTWQDMIDVNLTGAWHTIKAAVPHLRSGGRGGSVIMISSGAALMPPRGIGHYNAAKAGVVALATTLAQEVGPELIRVNCINPGNVDTPMIDNDVTRRLFMPQLENPTRADAEKPNSNYVAVNVLPVPWVDPADITELVLFLASDASRHITGVAVPVDAGYLIKKN
ncbi:mycofactocin-coupled SDR family oxidoreductase [Pseudonocardia xishanensis]|uniref:Mycofactocin-coupled SDR family oxidoreductase n=1 Tax=Pseudonocardia xishanensis TaxID=630995 RepID=A0ABP8RFF6_9PSEU